MRVVSVRIPMVRIACSTLMSADSLLRHLFRPPCPQCAPEHAPGACRPGGGEDGGFWGGGQYSHRVSVSCFGALVTSCVHTCGHFLGQ